MSSSAAFGSIALWDYRDTDKPAPPGLEAVSLKQEDELLPATPGFTEEQVASRIQAALADARRDWDKQALQQQEQRDTRLAATLTGFATQRQAYFRQVEQEVVLLAVAIARKILEREASLDPTLLQALVRIALDRLGSDTPARVRVAPAEASRWRQHQDTFTGTAAFEIVEDTGLTTGDCLLETPLGSANFGFHAQLKQVEQSFLDLLAMRPEPHGL